MKKSFGLDRHGALRLAMTSRKSADVSRESSRLAKLWAYGSALICLVLHGGVAGQALLAIPRISDTALVRESRSGRWRTSLVFDRFVGTRAYTMDGLLTTEPLSIFESVRFNTGSGESTLAALSGYDVGSQWSQELHRLGVARTLRRGYIAADSDLAFSQLRIGVSRELPVSLPLGAVRVNIGTSLLSHSLTVLRGWRLQQGEASSFDDAVMEQYFPDADSIAAFALRYGNLSLDSYEYVGFGESVAQLQWSASIKQYRTRLRQVTIDGRCGLVLPTTTAPSPDMLVAFDSGHDQSFGILCGGAVGLMLDGVLLTIDLQALFLNARTHEIRVKTDRTQTDLLLFKKARVTEVFGPEWKFFLTAEVPLSSSMIEGSAGIGYHFLKCADSTLYPQVHDVSFGIINSGQRAGRHESHQLSIRYSADITSSLTLAGQYMLPVGGRGILSGHTLTFGLSARF